MDIGNGRYRLIRRLGAGGTGVVYQGVDLILGRTVAIKVLHDLDRFDHLRREGRSLAQLNHAGIVALYDLVEWQGASYLVMEYVDGVNLDQLLAERGDLDLDDALGLFGRIAGAVAAAHAGGVLHCDLKPANILISSRGEVKLTDFTLARVESGGRFEGLRGGSVAYAAPEQLDGGEIDVRTDVYGLGAVLARLTRGYDRSSDAGRQIQTTIARATATAADDRFASVDEMLADLPAPAADLTRIIAASPLSSLTRVLPTSGEPADVPRLTRPRRRIPWRGASWVSALVAACALIGAFVFTHFTASAAPTTVTVPELVTSQVTPAKLVVHSLGLQVRIVQAYSATFGQGTIVAQQPAPEDHIAKGGTLTLTVSKGAHPVAVPNIQGAKATDAITSLRHLGLRVNVQTSETIFHNAGEVLGQSPNPGVLIRPGTTVTVTVSTHPWWWPFPG